MMGLPGTIGVGRGDRAKACKVGSARRVHLDAEPERQNTMERDRSAMTTPGISTVAAAGLLVMIQGALTSTASAQRQMERLGRGVVAIPLDDGKVFVGWRLLGTDPDDIAFNV